MYEFYEQPVPPKVWKKARATISDIYKDIPETEGCTVNIAKSDGCGAWCCLHQTPSVFYSEFLYSWNKIENSWTSQQKADLIIRCIRAYFDDTPTKGCVFWDKNTKLCQQHETRPFNCRCYSQIPEEEFRPRYERLKVLYEKNPKAVVRDQCNLTTSPNPPTKQQIDQWWAELTHVEVDIGIPPHIANDNPGGSYRTYHDHIMLKISSAVFLDHLMKLRQSGDKVEQEKFIVEFSEDLKRGLKL